MKKILKLILLSTVLISCNDKIEILAPAKDITVIIGLLDPNDMKHYIKINRLFTGENSAVILAKNRSDAEYESLDARVEEYTLNTNNNDTSKILDSFEIKKEEIDTKDSGVFYYPKQTIYFFEAKLKTADSDNNIYPLYRIKITKPDGQIVSSWTTILSIPTIQNNINYSSIFTNYGSLKRFGIAFMNGTRVSDKVTMKIKPPVFTKSMELNFKFKWKNRDKNKNIVGSDSITFAGGFKTLVVTPKKEKDSKENIFILNGTTFFKLLNDNVTNINSESKIVSRSPDSLEITLFFAGEDLQTYIELNSPSQTLLEQKPTYSNITNGIGVWSSRTKIVLKNIPLTTSTVDELVNGVNLGLTGDLGFCHTNPLNIKYCGN